MQPSSPSRVRVLCLALLILLTALPVPLERAGGSFTADNSSAGSSATAGSSIAAASSTTAGSSIAAASSTAAGSSIAAAAGNAVQQDRLMVVLMLAPLVDLYEGDTISLPYFVQDISPNASLTLTPLTPGTASVTASLGMASVTANGLRGTLTYTAHKAGEDVLTVTVSNYFGTATGTTSLTVKPRPNYNLDYLVVSQAEDAAGGFFMALFNGKGAFANVPDQPIEGKGSADYWFSLGVDSQVFVCRMEPPITGASAFTITGQEVPLAPLVPTPGFLPPFTLDLNFQPMQLNASSIVCQGLGGVSANFPWPATSADPNEYPMKGMSFPGEGGKFEINAPETWGVVFVTRSDE